MKKWAAVSFITGICICMIGIFTGCADRSGKGHEKDRSNPLAPKHIESEELIALETSFYRSAEGKYDARSYRFSMKTEENGSLRIMEESGDPIGCETDSSFAEQLQNVIRQYELEKNNGIQKTTAGLPPECGPYEFRAEYASGEILRFYMTSGPDKEWAGAIRDLFAEEFEKCGIKNPLKTNEGEKP